MKSPIKILARCVCICAAASSISCKRKAGETGTGAAGKNPPAESAAAPPLFSGESLSTEQWFGKLSGEWVSGDGDQSAVLEKMSIRFKSTRAWPELEGHTFSIREPGAFETRTGHYSLYTRYNEPDMIGVIKRDFTTEAYSSFTLYREGTKLARSRPPLPELQPPPEIQAILDKIPSIKAGEKKNAVFKRLGLDFSNKRSPNYLDGQSGMGDFDELWKLEPGNEWMCRISYFRPGNAPDGEIELGELKLVRGFSDDHKEGAPEAPEIEYEVYPSYQQGMIVTGPSEAHPAEKVQE